MRIAALLIIALALLLGCAQLGGMGQNNSTGGNEMKNQTDGTLVAAKGDTVQVDYIGKLENGTVFDTSIAAEAKKANLPLRERYDLLEFTIGAGQMIKGFDSAVVGMKVGDEKTVTLQPSEAYGEWSAERVISIPVANIQGGEQLRAGMEIQAQNGAVGKVTEVTNGTAKIDFNHELAGKNLVFTIRMAKITKR